MRDRNIVSNNYIALALSCRICLNTQILYFVFILVWLIYMILSQYFFFFYALWTWDTLSAGNMSFVVPSVRISITIVLEQTVKVMGFFCLMKVGFVLSQEALHFITVYIMWFTVKVIPLVELCWPKGTATAGRKFVVTKGVTVYSNFSCSFDIV